MAKLIRYSDSLSIALAERDAYTEAHCDRVESLSLQLGRRCDLSAHELEILRVASKLHDVGKIGIPDRILLKPGRLDSDEFDIIRTHSELGQNICDKIPHKHALNIGRFVRHHHEAYDGSGYPDGLAGEQIPICSRIITIVDSYDAMLTTRPYHRARSHEQVMEVMQGECGQKYDPLLFGYFNQIVSGTAGSHHAV